MFRVTLIGIAAALSLTACQKKEEAPPAEPQAAAMEGQDRGGAPAAADMAAPASATVEGNEGPTAGERGGNGSPAAATADGDKGGNGGAEDGTSTSGG